MCGARRAAHAGSQVAQRVLPAGPELRAAGLPACSGGLGCHVDCRRLLRHAARVGAGGQGDQGCAGLPAGARGQQQQQLGGGSSRSRCAPSACRSQRAAAAAAGGAGPAGGGGPAAAPGAAPSAPAARLAQPACQRRALPCRCHSCAKLGGAAAAAAAGGDEPCAPGQRPGRGVRPYAGAAPPRRQQQQPRPLEPARPAVLRGAGGSGRGGGGLGAGHWWLAPSGHAVQEQQCRLPRSDRGSAAAGGAAQPGKLRVAGQQRHARRLAARRRAGPGRAAAAGLRCRAAQPPGAERQRHAYSTLASGWLARPASSHWGGYKPPAGPAATRREQASSIAAPCKRRRWPRRSSAQAQAWRRCGRCGQRAAAEAESPGDPARAARLAPSPLRRPSALHSRCVPYQFSSSFTNPPTHLLTIL